MSAVYRDEWESKDGAGRGLLGKEVALVQAVVSIGGSCVLQVAHQCVSFRFAIARYQGGLVKFVAASRHTGRCSRPASAHRASIRWPSARL